MLKIWNHPKKSRVFRQNWLFSLKMRNLRSKFCPGFRLLGKCVIRKKAVLHSKFCPKNKPKRKLFTNLRKFLKLLFFKPQQKTNQNKPLYHLFHDLMLRKWCSIWMKESIEMGYPIKSTQVIFNLKLRQIKVECYERKILKYQDLRVGPLGVLISNCCCQRSGWRVSSDTSQSP